MTRSVNTEARRLVVTALTRYIGQHGEISDDPDDINSAASAIWDAFGLDTGQVNDLICSFCLGMPHERAGEDYRAVTIRNGHAVCHDHLRLTDDLVRSRGKGSE